MIWKLGWGNLGFLVYRPSELRNLSSLLEAT